jgi:RNA polymerase sigma-70 factor (ECF subfamily)
VTRPDPHDPRSPTVGLGASTDEALMLRVQDNDARAFEILYERHRNAVFGLALRMLDDHGLAADATQEAFISLWRSRDRYQLGRGRVKWWLLRIARNRAIDLHRRDRDIVPGNPGVFELRAGPDATEDEVIAAAERREVAGLVDGLPREQRQVIELAYYAGLSHAEITKRLGVPLGTIKGRIRLAHEKLRLAQPAHTTRTAA